MDAKPAIVVVGFNRLLPIKRLLSSLEQAYYPTKNTSLIISIDFSEEGAELREFVESYNWPHGKKELIIHKKNIGLRAHVISCGDLSEKYGSVIVLEDDLYVSPFFYHWATSAQQFYNEDEVVAGIALYSHAFNETVQLPFEALGDGSDVFFMQVACSWGQLWTREQWTGFKSWLGSFNENALEAISRVPENVRNWSKGSWKKFMCAYLVEQEKFFVYPRTSLSTNFSDPGSNYDFVEKYLQRPLELGRRNYQFVTFVESLAKYDAYCEMLPESLQRLNPGLCKNSNDLEVDLYGAKPKGLSKKMWLTNKAIKVAQKKFGLSLRPHELNSILEEKNGELSLVQWEDICSEKSIIDPYDLLRFYYGISEEKIVTRSSFEKMKRKQEEMKAYFIATRSSSVRKFLNFFYKVNP